MQTSTIGAIIRGLKRSLAATFALSSVSIASLLWASPSRALPFTSTPTWNFLNPSTASYDYFGSSVALSGNNALIGSYGENTASGAAYLYDVSTGGLLQSFLSPAPGNEFGSSVALSGNNALIGSYGENTASGAAYLYDVSTGGLLQSFLNPTPASSDAFGFSVALSGNNALIGALGEDNYSGAAYVYASTSSSPPTQAQSVPGPLPLLGLGAAFAWSRKLRRRTRQNIALSEQLD